MMQRLGPMPRSVATTGAHAVDFFSADGRMWHLSSRHVPYWPLDHVLHEQHGMPEEEVRGGAGGLGRGPRDDAGACSAGVSGCSCCSCCSVQAGRLGAPRAPPLMPPAALRPAGLRLPFSPSAQAMGLASFLQAALHLDPARRATAAELLDHPWLEGHLPHRPSSPPSPFAFWAADELPDGEGGSDGSNGGGAGLGEGEAARRDSPARSPSRAPAEGYRHHSPPPQ